MSVLKHDVISNDYCGAVMAKVKELNCIVISIYRPSEAPIPSFIEVTNKIREWLEGENSEVVILGDFNLPDMGAWEDIEVDLLRQRADKKEENDQGFKTRSGMIWLELTEQYRLHQKVKQFTRKEAILDLIWTNSCCPRNIRVMKNVLLTDHDTVLMDFTVTKPEKERVRSQILIQQKSTSMT